jgi:hypothetical protein
VTIKDKSIDANLQADSCLETIADSMAGQKGLLNISLDTEQEKVAVDYDPREMSPDVAAAVAQSVAPALQQQWQTSVMRLSKQG